MRSFRCSATRRARAAGSAAVVPLAVVVLLASAVSSASAQQARAGVVGDLLSDLDQVEQKMVGLARAIPADRYDWRPGAGVRSVGEMFLHVASDNYFLPTGVGVAAPVSTGIKADSYDSVVAFEKRSMSRDEIISELERSFAHLRSALQGTADSQLPEKLSLFGQEMSVSRLWILTVTHIHEHLGQGIAYARMNGIVPPWSQPAG